jgi:hypothetical protein
VTFAKHRSGDSKKPPLPQARTDLPREVVALASRLGVRADRSTSHVQLTQIGEIRLGPDSAVRPFSASQQFVVHDLEFTWRAWIRLVGPIGVRVTEGLQSGEGCLAASLLGVVRLARIRGGDLAFKGEAMRYLAELVWNPDAILFNRALEWRVLDQQRLLVAVANGQRRSEIRLHLDSNGDPISIAADARPRQVGRTSQLTPWFGRCSEYQCHGGRRIPHVAEAGWNIDGEPFIYWRARIQTWSMI